MQSGLIFYPVVRWREEGLLRCMMVFALLGGCTFLSRAGIYYDIMCNVYGIYDEKDIDETVIDCDERAEWGGQEYAL
jgi:hypothetical protein